MREYCLDAFALDVETEDKIRFRCVPHDVRTARKMVLGYVRLVAEKIRLKSCCEEQ